MISLRMKKRAAKTNNSFGYCNVIAHSRDKSLPEGNEGRLNLRIGKSTEASR